MRRAVFLFIIVLMALVVLPLSAQAGSPGGSHTDDAACWGQASAVFAQMGSMGQHASEQENPRDGLRNLARQLAEDGTIPDDSMQSLGAFVASALGLSIEACME